MESNWRWNFVEIGCSYWTTSNPFQVYPPIGLAAYWYTAAFRDWYVTNTIFGGQPIVVGIALDTSIWEMPWTLGPLVGDLHFPYGLPVPPD